MSATSLRAAVDRQRIVDMIGRLIEQNTVNPPGNEYLLKDYLVGVMRELGMETEVRAKVVGRTNVIGRIRRGDGPSVAIVLHMDTVPAGDGWDSNPFVMIERDGVLHGRGVLDDKGPFGAAHEAVRVFLQETPEWRGEIQLVAAADEETGSQLGMIYLLETGFTADVALIPDNGLNDRSIIGEKGALGVRIVSHGKQAHGSTPHLGVNAVAKLAAIVPDLTAVNWAELGGHPRFEPTTMNLGLFNGGVSPNTVPATAELSLDFRYPVGVAPEDILERLRSILSRHELGDAQARLDLIEVKRIGPHVLDEDAPLARAFHAAAADMGIKMRFGTSGGITVAKNLHEAGVPALTHYPHDADVAHISNEYVKVDDLVAAAALYARMLQRLLAPHHTA